MVTSKDKNQEFYNLKYDAVFNKVIANDKEILNLILSDVLDEEVEVISIESPILGIENVKDKGQRVDVIVRTKKNVKIHIEVNTDDGKIIRERNLGYYCILYGRRLEKGGRGYKEKYKAIHIDINFKGSEKEEKEIYYIKEEESGKKYSKEFKIIRVNVARYKKNWYDKCKEGEKKHIYIVMLDANREELEELSKVDKKVEEVKRKVIYVNENGEVVQTMSREYEGKILARAIGEEKGEERGIRKGRKEGRIEGKREGIMENQIVTAKKMLEDNIDIETIMKYTNLSKKEIEKLN